MFFVGGVVMLRQIESCVWSQKGLLPLAGWLLGVVGALRALQFDLALKG
jgi:hypothetical protein